VSTQNQIGAASTDAVNSSRTHLLRASRFRAARRQADAVAILESLDAAVVARDLDGVITSWNSGAEALYGFSAAEMIGQTSRALVPSRSWGWEVQVLEAVLLAGVSDSYESERVSKDGSTPAVTVQISPIRNAERTIVGACTIEQPVESSWRQARSPAGAESSMRGAFDHAPLGIALVSIDPASPGSIIRVNDAFERLTGYSAEKLETTRIAELLHPEDVATDLAAMSRLAAGEQDGFELEQRILHAERHAVWVALSASLVRGGDGAPLYCIRQLQDIEERKRYEGELGYLVEHDPLSGLLNRRGFMRELTHEVAYSRRYGGPGAVLFLDLDDFKWINDNLGHSAGDEVLSEVARVLLGRLRETDALARLGGDEFAVLLPRTSTSEAHELASSLIASIRDECEIVLPGGRRVTLSVGINWFGTPGEELTADDVLTDADSAMYAAKDAGKDRVTMASTATHEQTSSRITWAERVRRAVDESLFQLHCQPIIDLATGDVAQWELLLRLPGERGELILPAQFLYAAERSGLILEIDCWVLRQAVKLIADQRDWGVDLRLAVNISGRSVGDPELLALVERELQSTAIDPASLTLEVTETAAIANIDRARGFATKLRLLGCRFALDDFGAGFGSFYYLKHIPFDYVKIDGEFIRNLPTHTTDQLILDSIVQMSRGLGKHTIAEFVGSSETVEVLKEHGVDYGQGFHLGRPVPLSQALLCP
jgi:diguanylate cyclase (GGDEF)-like protein/PAS domain S-box-containing protein